MPDELQVSFTLNGLPRECSVPPRVTLADLLRDVLGCTGVHLGCEQGVCGACTVIINGGTARSCLMLGVQAAGASIVTIEGLAGEDGRLHPIQQAFSATHALQCGFCTPGMILAAVELLDENTVAVAVAGPRGPIGKPVPVHRVREHRVSRRARGGGAAARTGTRENARYQRGVWLGVRQRSVMRPEPGW